eukprot:TRINITY_DN223_c0_g1_i1.p2 TRINITY_DN223_c0_g1~~TRINITY_DN223_c0_g1_i1.p2  ORF type:complete len:189 (-),score=38.32 TRINITY_DN223_c0_g1_i1:1862-2428(-)
MASVVWVSVFFLLMMELVITAILVLPFPRFVRKFIARKIFTYDLGKRIRFISNFIILGLILAVSDAVQTLRHLEQKEAGETSNQATNDARVGYIAVSFDKQRKFRAERNMYLAGFSLTLMFVIARIVELMQEVVNVEEQKDVAEQRLKDVNDAASTATSIPTTQVTHKEDTSTLRRRANTTTNTDKTE